MTLNHELDPYIRKDLKPFLYQTPAFYSVNHQLSGLVQFKSRIFVQDTFGALYETSADKKFPEFKTNLAKEDQLSFKVNEDVHFTYDLLDVSEVYD